MDVEISKIVLTGWNPRKFFDAAEMEELEKSIGMVGIIEPLVVRSAGDRYELVAGERRFKAALKLKFKTVPVVVKELTDAQVREIMLVENLQRSGLEPLEEAASLEALLKDGTTQEELAKKLGKSQGWIANRLRLLKAPKEIKDLIISRKITAKHALLLLPFQGYPVFKTIFERLNLGLKTDGEVTVFQLGEYILSCCCNYQNWGEQRTVLSLDELPYEFDALKKYVDFSGCKGCEHAIALVDKKKRYCLKTDCWKNKFGQAKQKLQKKEKEQVELLKGKAVVDRNKLPDTAVRILDDVSWDKKECKDCENCKRGKTKEVLCIKPSCYNKKEAAHRKLEDEKEAEEKRISLAALDVWLEKKKELTTEDLKLLATVLIENTNYFPGEEVLRPWQIKNATDASKVLKKIPEKDLHKAVLRLGIFALDEDFVEDTLKQRLPEVWKERVKLAKQTKLPEKTKPNQPAGVSDASAA